MFVVIATTDNRNVGRVFDTLPEVGDEIDLNGYVMRIDSVETQTDDIVISNANYIMRLEERDESV